ncbi:PIN domain-containing protein, partial [Acidobacteria bacterium ACD]|nr:PIN domain-containing protein [Acidobacteria bacterium ACD]
MSVFVDTSAFLALLDAGVEGHAAAAHAWRGFLESDERLVTSSYVLVESYALVRRRLGTAEVRSLASDFLPLVEVDWVDAATHDAGLSAFLAANQRGLSLVACVSF